MSAVPPIYQPATNFATEASQPITVAGLPGAEMDAEFTGIQATLGAVRSRLSEIQRDDGLMRNGVVGIDALSSAAIQALGSNALNPRGEWAANRAYAVGDVFSRVQETRLVKTAYTSGATYNLGSIDTNNTSVLGMPPDVGQVTRKTFNGNGSTTVFTLDVAPVYDTNIRVFVNGLFTLAGTDWTLSGTTLTFTSAPAVGTNNIVTEVGQVSSVDLAVLPGSSVNTVQLANLAVTTAKIADANVTTGKIADAAINSAKIANNAVTAAKFPDASITTAKIANGAITSEKIATAGVATSNIQNNAINSDKIADNAVASGKIPNGAITGAKIEDLAITEEKIADGSITNAKLSSFAVNTDQLEVNSVTSIKIADGAVIGAKILDGTITGAKLNGAQTGVAPVFGARAWVSFAGLSTAENRTATYVQNNTLTVTVTLTNHGFRAGDWFSCAVTSGAVATNSYQVTQAFQPNVFTFAVPSAVTTSGSMTIRQSTILGSGNVYRVSGINGYFLINFTTPLPTANYAMMGSCTAYDGTTVRSGVAIRASGGANTNWGSPAQLKTTGAIQIVAGDTSTGSLTTSPNEVNLVFFG
jgi:hypothetical protein